MDRKHYYKHQHDTPAGVREKCRSQVNELRKQKRDNTVSNKRVRVEEDEQEYDISVSDVVEATCKLKDKSCKSRLDQIRLLRQAFSQGSALIDSFVSVDGAVDCVISLLTGLDAELQLEAAWCLTNMAAGTDEHAVLVAKHAGAYLVTFLHSSNVPLQDQCAWAIGNVAGGTSECRQVVLSQGAVPALIMLLKSAVPNVVQSAAFALSNLARDNDLQQVLVDNGVIVGLAENLQFHVEKLNVVTEVAWVMTYLAASCAYSSEIQSVGVPARLIDILMQSVAQDVDNFQLITPVLRCLGNIICGADDDLIASVCQSAKPLFLSFLPLLHSEHNHLRKESLWVLSNIVVFPRACDETIDAGLLPHILALLSDVFDIRKEAAYCLCNMAALGSKVCVELFRQQALKHVVPLLKINDVEVVHMALCLVQMILQHVPEEGKTEFEQCQGLSALETLEYSNTDVLRQLTGEILETHFYKDDE